MLQNNQTWSTWWEIEKCMIVNEGSISHLSVKWGHLERIFGILNINTTPDSAIFLQIFPN